MKRKVVGSFVAIIVGICLIILSMYIKNQIGAARETVQKGQGFFSKNPIGKAVGDTIEGAAEGKIAYYEAIGRWSLYGGIVLIAIGAGCIFFCRKK